MLEVELLPAKHETASHEGGEGMIGEDQVDVVQDVILPKASPKKLKSLLRATTTLLSSYEQVHATSIQRHWRGARARLQAVQIFYYMISEGLEQVLAMKS